MNDDGKPDVIVMAWDSRPKILRNTSVGGVISFVEWTPGNTFVRGVDANYGFHAVAFDSDGSSADYPDIFLGTRWEADLFFENIAANEQTEGGLGGVLPRILDLTSVAVKGTFSGNPQTDVYVTAPTESFVPVGFAEVITVSVVFNPPVCNTTLKVEKRNGTQWTLLVQLDSEGEERAAQFDELNADQLKFTLTGTGCGPLDPYYLEVVARTD